MLLAAVWWWAAVAKLRRPLTLDRAATTVPWLGLVPAGIARAGLRTLPWVELALGGALLVPGSRRGAAVASSVLLVAFGLVLGAALVRASLLEPAVGGVPGPEGAGVVAAVAACGCFGGRAPARPAVAVPVPVPGPGTGTRRRADVADLHLAGWHAVRPFLLAAAALVVLVPCGCG